jgi:hypothetical protein
MDFDVFISYSSKDKPAADAACAVLESAGIRCWIAPRDVMPGIEYGSAIVDAIENCRVMVLIFSSNANESAQIRREIERAVKKGVTIIPVRIEDVEPTKSMEYFLGAIHWLDALTPPLERHFQHLAKTIKAMLQAKEARTEAVGDQPTTRFAPAGQPRNERPSSEERTTARSQQRWLLPALIGVAALAVLAAAAALAPYVITQKPKHPLGAPQDGVTLSGPAESILRYYPSPSQEDCRADCERAGEDCMGYTWVKPGGYQAGDQSMCYLDKWFNGYTKHPCCITATRIGTVPK